MISLFRRLRQKLLIQNRLSRYVIYALGEIFLVVIGILIALQVNNWNEERKTKNRERDVLKRLQQEMVQDSLNLESSISLVKYKAEQAERLLRAFEIDSEIENPPEFVRDVFLVGRGGSYLPYIPAYNELVANGELGIIQNEEIIKQISSYLNRMNGLQSFLYDEGDTRRSVYNAHIHRYFSALIMNEIWELGTQTEKLTDDIMESYETDIPGYLSDPDSDYHMRNVAAVNLELKLLYEQSMESFTAPILNLINQEIHKN
ncbi:MAG: hypothetical protein CL555_12825 [Algoriphagus sp.]|nr:hypothetical protein [Algoriphagus sp.]